MQSSLPNSPSNPPLRFNLIIVFSGLKFSGVLLLMGLLINKTLFAQNQKEIDSLETILKTQNDDTNKIKTLLYLGVNISKLQENEKAKKILTDVINLCEKIEKSENKIIARTAKTWKGKCYTAMGITFFNQSEYFSALEFYSKALDIFNDYNVKSSASATLNNIGNVYFTIGDLPKALDFHLRSLKLTEENGTKEDLSSSYGNVGDIFSAMKNFSEADKYFQKSIDFAKSGNDLFEVGSSNEKFGLSCYNQGKIKESIFYFKTALKYFRSLDILPRIVCEIAFISGAYVEIGKCDSALYFLTSVADEAEKLEKDNIKVNYLNCAAGIYDCLNQPDKAIAFLKKSIEVGRISGNKLALQNSYFQVAETYKKMKQYQFAMEYYQLYFDLQDTLFRETTQKQIAEMEAKYQNEKKQKEISLLQKDSEINQLALAKRKNQIVSLSIGIGLILILGFVFYQWKQLRIKQKFNDEMVHQQELRLKAIIQTQEEERNRIAKDLHDGVGQLLGGLKLSWQNLPEGSSIQNPELKERITSSSKILDEAANEVRSISHQMMPQTLINSGLVAALSDMLGKSFNHSGIKYQFSPLNISARFKPDIELCLYRIAQELVNNILKHSGATEATILLSQNENLLILAVEDNGKGFNFEEQKGKGLGMMNIITRAKSINATADFEAGHNGGTIATLKVPLT